MLKLYGYKAISPNVKGQFYLFRHYKWLMKTLEPVKTLELDLDNYRIDENGIVMLPKTAAHPYPIETYFIETDDEVDVDKENKFTRCFLVKSSVIQSDMLIYTCQLDEWGTYYPLASIKNAIVKRSNRDIGIGIYDDVVGTQGKGTIYYAGGDFLPAMSFYIVFSFSTEVNSSSKESSYIQLLLAIKLSDLLAQVDEHNKADGDYTKPPIDASGEDCLLLASLFLGGLFNDNSINFNGSPIRAWVVMDNVGLTFSDIDLSKFEFKYSGPLAFDSYNVTGIKVVNPGTFDRKIDFGNTLTSKIKDNHIEVGFPYHTMAIRRFTDFEDASVYLRYSYGSDLSVSAIQGTDSEDITQGIELPIISNTTILSTAKEMQRSFKIITTSLGAIAAGIVKGGVPGGVLAATGSLLSAAINTLPPKVDQTKPTGDALSSLSMNKHDRLRNPNIFVAIPSIAKEATIAAIDGANYCVPVVNIENNNYASEDLRKITDCYALSNAWPVNASMAVDCEVSGIPTDAIEAITSALKAGIRIAGVEPYNWTSGA